MVRIAITVTIGERLNDRASPLCDFTGGTVTRLVGGYAVNVRYGSRLCEKAGVAAHRKVGAELCFGVRGSQDRSSPDRLDQQLRAERGEHPFQIVGQDVEAHLRPALSRVRVLK